MLPNRPSHASGPYPAGEICEEADGMVSPDRLAQSPLEREEGTLTSRIEERFMDRRHFLKTGMAMGCTAAVVPPATAQTGTGQAAGTAPMYKFFTGQEAAMTGAICEQIVPRDDYPGAKENGVVNFIDGVLSGPMGRFYKAKYREGLLRIKMISRERHGKNFAALAWNDQTKVLLDLESGAAGGISGKEFFALIVRHTMEGYYGNPSDGSNRGGASWKMINFKGRF
jgi:gluconate 2-dehydrogenase gamma chain